MCGISAFLDEATFKEAIEEIAMMLYSLQHRGQEAFGISVLSKDRKFLVMRSRHQLFSLFLKSWKKELIEKKVIGGIGHVRYSTTGSYSAPSQPVLLESNDIKFSLAFNGTIANYKELDSKLARRKGDYRISPKIKNNDSITLANVLYSLYIDNEKDIVEALRYLPNYVIGGYSIVVETNEPRIVIAKDPYGFRPLSYSYESGFYAASENPALELIGKKSWKEVLPGEIVSYDGGKLERIYSERKVEPAPCLFEYVYFSRSDSVFNGISIYDARINMGRYLAEYAPVDGDVVIPVPDSGRVIALGYSKASGIPIEEGIVVNKYLGRGFITPPFQRPLVTKIKYNIVEEAVRGKEVVLIDDSIVRGTTMSDLVPKLKLKGAKKVHIRIGSPPYKCPCYMGIDVPTKSEVIAKNDEKVIAKMIGADSLIYNSLDNLIKAVPLRNLCHACFSCKYPFSEKSSCEYIKMLIDRGGRNEI
ncbi:amidophosphoribosyltransferase [Fervidicoccus sp.]|uniref:amidophosphoribosyltransferase n=1 Tax=Fervidicoccus sp. TaxID=2060324 RepID=UPI003D12B99F